MHTYDALTLHAKTRSGSPHNAPNSSRCGADYAKKCAYIMVLKKLPIMLPHYAHKFTYYAQMDL